MNNPLHVTKNSSLNGSGRSESIRIPKVIVANGDGLHKDALAKALAQCGDIEIVGMASEEWSALKLCIDAEADLMLVDANLPSIGGFRTAIEARLVRPNLGILVIGNELNPIQAANLMNGDTSGIGILLETALDDIEMLLQAIMIVAKGGSVFEQSLVGRLVNLSETRSDGLTPRELEVLSSMADGWNNAAIADELGVAVRTVEKRVGRIFMKLGLSNNSERHKRVSAALHYRDKCRPVQREDNPVVAPAKPAGLLIEMKAAG
ncbi:MAG: response regulator transcription factor [Chloroflexi bacterium]|nr:response regulator transcription factor [Chloroflexota bacterium]